MLEFPISKLVMPLFVMEGKAASEPLRSIPGQYAHTVDNISKYAKSAREAGISTFLLFDILKDKVAEIKSIPAVAQLALSAIEAVKSAAPGATIITDLCVCQYFDHGHCGVIEHGVVENDKTLSLISELGVLHAKAGADLLMPSGMADGMTIALRRALDDAKISKVGVMAQSAKFASAFYGPFRKAVHAPEIPVSKESYQLGIGDSAASIREVLLDIEEGADVVLIKPSLYYTDIMRDAKNAGVRRLGAFITSGETALLRERALVEKCSLIDVLGMTYRSLHRAGADIIISYDALEYAKNA